MASPAGQGPVRQGDLRVRLRPHPRPCRSGDAPRRPRRSASTYAAGRRRHRAPARTPPKALARAQPPTALQGRRRPRITPILDGMVMPEGPAAAFAAGPRAEGPLHRRRQQLGGQPLPADNHPARPDAGRRCSDKLVAAYGGAADRGRPGISPPRPRSSSPTAYLARLHAKNGQKAWVYYFSYIPAAQRATIHGLAPRRRAHLRLRQPAGQGPRQRPAPSPPPRPTTARSAPP